LNEFFCVCFLACAIFANFFIDYRQFLSAGIFLLIVIAGRESQKQIHTVEFYKYEINNKCDNL